MLMFSFIIRIKKKTAGMKIQLFGISKDIVGERELALPKDPSIQTVRDLKKWILQKYPRMGNLSSIGIAVDLEYAEDDHPIGEAKEIALIPPVSGG
ncbi:MAG: MoaD/ThiS family protein [Cytophagales bacterium]|nr:MoaD/ThiS family protein [Cyclobacterium marinum]MBR9777293.1 MoaD/ThiS family protein [Cytophagales bacterium]